MSKYRHIVLYFPGLGDHYDNGRYWALKTWRWWGIDARLVPLRWYGGGSYGDKLELAKCMIEDALDNNSTKVTLIGESAGASLALNVASLYPGLHKVITIAGVNSSRLSISPVIQQQSPSFRESASRVSAAVMKIDPRIIHNFCGFMDGSVLIAFSRVKDASFHRVPALGHLFTIVSCLTILSPYIARIIKNK